MTSDRRPQPRRVAGMTNSRSGHWCPTACAMISSADRRGEQDDDPVDLEAPDQLPHVAVEAGEEERREMPDGLLRAELAQAAAGEAAADREGEGAPFADEQRRDARA